MALPGVKTTFLDRFYNLGRTNLPGSPILAIIAKRNNVATSTVPDIEPYFATGEKEVIDAFGDGSYLHRAYKEASTGGASRIVLIPLPANTAFNHSAGTVTSNLFPAQDLFTLAFDAAEAIRADVIVPWGQGSDLSVWDDHATPATPAPPLLDWFYADNTTSSATSWAAKVAARCAQITADSYPCFAIIGVRGMTGLERPNTTQQVAGLTFPNLISKETITTGHFVSIIAAEVRPIGYNESWGWANGAVTYGALATRLDPWRALTAKPVYNVEAIRFQPTNAQALALNNKGVVVASIDFSGVIKWVDACTFAQANSDFIRLSTLRISFDAVKIVLSVAEAYKGEPMSMAAQNAFETQISSRLRSMTQVGALNNSDFRVTYVPSANQALIDLAITPAFELREIVLTLSVNF